MKVFNAVHRKMNKGVWFLPAVILGAGLVPQFVDSVVWQVLGGCMVLAVIATVMYCWLDLNKELKAEAAAPVTKEMQYSEFQIRRVIK